MKTTGAFTNRSTRLTEFRLNPRNKAGGARGFTIVEVAIAMLVLALAITTAITVMQQSFLQFDTARNLGVAGSIMQCEMEKERLFSWTKLNDVSYTPTIDASFARNPAMGGRFTLSRTLTTLTGHSAQEVQITLTVRWRSYDGHSLTRSYTSYFTKGGLYDYFYSP